MYVSPTCDPSTCPFSECVVTELPRFDPDTPSVKVNGVVYVIDYGTGWGTEWTATNWSTEPPSEYRKMQVPVYVWRAFLDPEYTAPAHVAAECNRLFELRY